jgi:hypothetical protein
MAVVAIMGKAAFIDSSHLHELRTHKLKRRSIGTRSGQ